MENIFSAILSMSLDSVWLIVAVIVFRAIMQKSPKYFRKILWGLVGLRLVIPFSFKSSLSLVPGEVPQTADRVAGQVVAANVEQGFSFADAVSVFWIVVCIGFLIYGIVSYIKLKFKIIDGVLAEGNIYYSEKVESPFVCGFIRPKIYLPYGLDDKTQTYVLQHEKTHIRYGDHIIKAVSFVVLCVHWFNPLVWVAYFMLCKDIELSCDESVIKNMEPDGFKQYAKALLDLGVNRGKFTVCPVAFGEVSIKTRIRSVIGYKKAGKILIVLSLFLCTVVAICFMTEPKVKAQENKRNPEKVVVEEITEATTEKVTATTTGTTAEPTIEPSTQALTECLTEQTVVNDYEETVEDTEELYDDSMFENEDDGIEEDPLNKVNVMEPDLADVHDPTSIYEGVKQNDFTSYHGTNTSYPPNNSTHTPTFPSISWDPSVTQAPAHNYGNTNHPRFEGNQWVY